MKFKLLLFSFMSLCLEGLGQSLWLPQRTITDYFDGTEIVGVGYQDDSYFITTYDYKPLDDYNFGASASPMVTLMAYGAGAKAWIGTPVALLKGDGYVCDQVNVSHFADYVFVRKDGTLRRMRVDANKHNDNYYSVGGGPEGFHLFKEMLNPANERMDIRVTNATCPNASIVTAVELDPEGQGYIATMMPRGYINGESAKKEKSKKGGFWFIVVALSIAILASG